MSMFRQSQRTDEQGESCAPHFHAVVAAAKRRLKQIIFRVGVPAVTVGLIVGATATPAQAGQLEQACGGFGQPGQLALSAGVSYVLEASIEQQRTVYPAALCSNIHTDWRGRVTSVGYTLQNWEGIGKADACWVWVDIDLFDVSGNYPPYFHSQGTPALFGPNDRCWSTDDADFVANRLSGLPIKLQPNTAQCTTMYARQLSDQSVINKVAQACSVIS